MVIEYGALEEPANKKVNDATMGAKVKAEKRRISDVLILAKAKHSKLQAKINDIEKLLAEAEDRLTKGKHK